MKLNEMPNELIEMIFKMSEDNERHDKEAKYNKNKFNFVIKELMENPYDEYDSVKDYKENIDQEIEMETEVNKFNFNDCLFSISPKSYLWNY